MARVSNSIKLDTKGLDASVKTVEKAVSRMEGLKKKGKKLKGRGAAAKGRSRPGLGEDVTAKGAAAGLRDALTSGPALARAGLAAVVGKLVGAGLGLAGRREKGDTVREIVKDMIPSIASSIPILSQIRQLADESAKRQSEQLKIEIEADASRKDLEKRLQDQPSLRREAARTAAKRDAVSWERRRRIRAAILKGLR